VQQLLQQYADPASSDAPSSGRLSHPRWDSDSDACAADVTTAPSITDKKDTASNVVTVTAAAAGFSQPEALRRSREGGWSLFHNNAYAFLYSSLYRRAVPLDTKVSRRRVHALMPHLTPEEIDSYRRVQHSFAPIC